MSIFVQVVLKETKSLVFHWITWSLKRINTLTGQSISNTRSVGPGCPVTKFFYWGSMCVIACLDLEIAIHVNENAWGPEKVWTGVFHPQIGSSKMPEHALKVIGQMFSPESTHRLTDMQTDEWMDRHTEAITLNILLTRKLNNSFPV